MDPKLLATLVPTDPALFFTRSDPNDPRMGDAVSRDPERWSEAEVVLVGCPQDEGVRRNKGRVGARRAPAEIRRALYRYPVSREHQGLRLLDLGDVENAPELEETHDRLHAVVRALVRAGKKVVVLGGGNDISFPDAAALSSEVERALVLNIDRHLDVRADTPRNSGTSYRQLLEGGYVDPRLFHEVGTNSFANSVAYTKWVEEQGAHVHWLGDLREGGVGATVERIVREAPADGIFFGFDMDVVCAMEAPGVSDPGPMGLTAREICEIADVAAADPRTRIVEISEMNPEFDRDGITAKLAANVVMRALARRSG